MQLHCILLVYKIFILKQKTLIKIKKKFFFLLNFALKPVFCGTFSAKKYSFNAIYNLDNNQFKIIIKNQLQFN